MRHITDRSDDVPATPFVMERRRTPDRRAEWRGGRRDADWLHRPPGAWLRLDERRATRRPRLLSSLNLW